MPMLKFDKKTLSADAVAGFTFAVVNIPQGMANALLANVNPVLGLYTLMIATPVGALVTSSVFMNVSTTSALSVVAGDALIYVPANDRTVHLAALVLLTGLVQLLFGVMQLGSMLRFVSNAVMVGFITGVAPHVKSQLASTGIDTQIGEARIFLEQPQLGASMNEAITAAHQWLNMGK